MGWFVPGTPIVPCKTPFEVAAAASRNGAERKCETVRIPTSKWQIHAAENLLLDHFILSGWQSGFRCK